MNLDKLFDVQRKLDAEIERKHPAAPGEDRLAKRILALQVELGELANEWRGFKFWSNDQEPRTVGVIHTDWDDKGNAVEWDTFVNENPLLEEYVDCLHFILSIGLKHGYDEQEPPRIIIWKSDSIERHFTKLIRVEWENHIKGDEEYYHEGFEKFIGLGEMLGFTWEQITEAYMSKNKVNWERQENGY